MGILDRLHDSITGLGNALEAPVGFVKDLLTSPTDNRGMIDGIYHDFVDRSGQLISGAIGPQGFTGSLIGGLPEGARAGVNEAIKPAENAMDAAYTDLIGRPISTALTAASLAEAGHGGVGGGTVAGSSEWSKFFSGDTWTRAWNISEHRSPGQAMALAFMTKDITNPTQVAKAQGSDFYHAASGITDAATRWFLDPTQQALGTRTEYLKELHTVDAQAAITAMQRDGTISKFADGIMSKGGTTPNADVLAAQIRNDLLPKSYLGAQQASILAQSAVQGGAPLVEQATRVLMGKVDDLEAIRAQHADIAGEIDRIMQRREMVNADVGGWQINNTPTDLADQEAELNALYSEQDRLSRLDKFSTTMQAIPHPGPVDRARAALTQTDWYQNGLTSKPLRVVFDRASPHLIQYDSQMGDASLWHFLQSSDMPLAQQQELRGAYLNAPTNGARVAIKNAAVDQAIQSVADSGSLVSSRQFPKWLANSTLDHETQADLAAKYGAATGRDAKLAVLKEASTTAGIPVPGLSVAELNQHLAEYAQNRDITKQILDGRKYDGVGRSTVAFEDENGIANTIHYVEKPLYETQLADLDTFPDLRRYRSASTTLGRLRGDHPLLDMPEHLAKMYTDVWKPTTVLRPALAVRIVSDEGLRVASKLGALTAAKLIGSGAKDMVKDTAGYMLGKAGLPHWEHSSRGMEPFLVNGHMLQGAYGTIDDGAQIFKQLNKARDTFGRDIVTAEGGIYDQLKSQGDWHSLTSTDPLYGPSWQRDVNLQIGQSALGRKMIDLKLQGATRVAEGEHDAGRVIRELSAGANPYAGIPEDHVRLFRGERMDEPLSALNNAGHDWSHSARTAHNFSRGTNGRILYVDLPADEAGNLPRGWSLGSASPDEIHQYEPDIENIKNLQSRAAQSGQLDIPTYRHSEGPSLSRDVRLSRTEAVAEAAKWLSNTPEGRGLSREVGRAGSADWAQRVGDQIDAYLPTDTLKQAAVTQTAHEQMLHDEFARTPEQFPSEQLPVIHGEILKQDLGTSAVTRFLKSTRDSLYKNLVDKPDAYLIRDPFMDALYQQETRRQIQVLTGQKEYTFAERMVRRAAGLPEQSPATNFALTQADLDNIMHNSRQYALGEAKNLLHNFSEQSRLGEMLRYVSPFYSAWQQIFTRWSGIAVENPAFIRRMDMLWRAPEKAGVVTDGKGNVLDENDNIAHPVDGGPWKTGDPAADTRRNITLPVPKWAKDIPLVGGLAKDGNELRFGKDSLNLLLHGIPSFGPLGQVPINEVAKARPDLAESLKWALPYGVSQNSLDILKPTIVRHVAQGVEGDANRSYAYTVMQLYNDRVVDFNRGIRATPPTWAEAENDAQSFWKVKTLAGLALPFSPQFVSPYQPYIDSYRGRLEYDGTLTPAQKQDPAYLSPKEWFLKTYGPEFFPLTTSMSKSVDGVPPTVAGFEVRQQYKDLIGKYPDLGALIVGQTGAGSFSGAVYDAQFQTKTSAGGPAERQVQQFPDFAKAPATELGWIYFSKTMDMIDVLRIQRRLPSLNVKAAGDLAAMKQNLVYNLAQKYPSWFEDYMSTDSTKWDQRINGMTAIVKTPGLDARPEFQGLQQYLDGRRELVSVLEQVKSHNLSAAANAGLAQQWDQYVNDLVAQNPAFAALYYRWLQNDPVIVSPLTQMAGAGTLNQTGPLTAVSA